MKKIMILGASVLQLPAILKAKEMGLFVVAVDMDKNAVGFNYSDVSEVISTIDIPKVLECAKKHKIDGIITIASDMPMRTVAAVSKELGLIGINEDTAIKATNKAKMREAFKKENVPIPKFHCVNNYNDYINAVSNFNGKFIVKPTDNSGSRGIYLVDNKKDIDIAFDYSKKYSRNGEIVVEEFMQGQEVSVETLTINGKTYIIAITDKLTTGAPHFVEMGHSQPTSLGVKTAERIRKVAKAANKAIGIINGPSHTEIIVTEEGPKIVELGARLGGDCITTHLVPLATGVNMVECCIKIALGEKPDIEPKFNKGSAIRYFHQHEGMIQSIVGIDEAKSIDGVQQVSVVHGIGEKVTKVTDSASRVGFVISHAREVADAIKIAESAMKCVHFITIK